MSNEIELLASESERNCAAEAVADVKVCNEAPDASTEIIMLNKDGDSKAERTATKIIPYAGEKPIRQFVKEKLVAMLIAAGTGAEWYAKSLIEFLANKIEEPDSDDLVEHIAQPTKNWVSLWDYVSEAVEKNAKEQIEQLRKRGQRSACVVPRDEEVYQFVIDYFYVDEEAEAAKKAAEEKKKAAQKSKNGKPKKDEKSKKNEKKNEKKSKKDNGECSLFDDFDDFDDLFSADGKEENDEVPEPDSDQSDAGDETPEPTDTGETADEEDQEDESDFVEDDEDEDEDDDIDVDDIDDI